MGSLRKYTPKLLAGEGAVAPTSHITVPGSSPSYSVLPIQLPAGVPGRQQVMAQIHGFLPPTWENWREHPAPDFSLTWPWLLLAFEE